MIKKENRKAIREKKHMRIRNRFSGTAERPRLAVYRSNKHIYAQIIDDTKGVTLVQASTMDASVKGTFDEVNKTAAAKAIGKLIGERALAAGVEKVVFDRSGYLYTGRVASLAEGAREAGLKF